jgi:amino acid adenylation domain-containing protein
MTYESSPSDICIRRFDAAARRHPDRIAIEDGDACIDYATLAGRARALAKRLLASGIDRGSVVAVDLPRGIDAVVAILATHYVGGAYLPLGPHLPDARVETVLAESRAQAMIGALPRPIAHSVRQLVPDSQTLEIAESWSHGFPAPEMLAYVIYTSGSTGTPKGVAIEQEQLARLCDEFQAGFEATAEDRFSHLATPSFDASVWELWPALSLGATISIPDETVKRSPFDLLAWFDARRIDVAWLPTALTTELFRLPGAAREGLRLPRIITVAGERLSAFVPSGFPSAVFNCYGPTEDTVCTTLARVPERANAGDAASPSIGRALPGKYAILLDAEGMPVADGESGEIHIGGWGLTRGYLNRPDLTAERFVERELPTLGRVRLYRTGDLARRDARGDLHFIGRSDRQVNLHGYRIELSEVEHALRALPGVSDVVVREEDTADGDRALVGHVLMAAPAADSPAKASQGRALRQSLRNTLPEYMVPSTIFVYDAFPKTEHDKIDPTRLQRLNRDAEAGASRDTDVLSLAREILGADIDPSLGFVENGGNSVAGIRFCTRLAAVYGVRVSFRDLLALPSLDALAIRIAEQVGALGGPDDGAWIVRRRDDTTHANLKASPSQTLVWFLDRLEPCNPAYIAKAMVFLQGMLDVEALFASLQDLIDRHEIYRTRFEEDSGGVRQIIEPAWRLDVPIIEMPVIEARTDRGLLSSRCAEIMAERLSAPFDLREGKLVRFALVRIDDDMHALLHVEHHIVHDGWSYNVLLSELFASYRDHADRSRSESPDRPREPPFQFADFTLAQQAWSMSPHAENQRRYWQEQLKDAPALLELPTDRPRGEDATFVGDTLRETLPRALWLRCETLARRCGVTPFALVLAVFSLVLSRHARSRDICIGSGFANRNWTNAERILGMVINTVVLRTRIEEDETFQCLLGRTGQVVAGALANQELAFSEVVKMVNPSRIRGANPLFQVFMGFHDAPMEEIRLDGLDITVKEALGNGASKFDLSLVVIPRRGQIDGDGQDPVHMVWEFNTTLFPRSYVAGLKDGFLRALETVVDRPDIMVDDVPLLDSAEEARLVARLCPPPLALPEWSSIDAQVERIAHAEPRRPAIECVDESLDYGSLHERVLRIAGALADAGIGPGDRVAVGLRRRCHLVAALLAIHRVGACYVPVDPRYPRERTEYVLESACARLLLTEAAVGAAFDGVAMPQMDVVEATFTTAGAPPRAAMPEQVAYAIYTSGSTGKPKGVAISRAAFENFAAGITMRVGLRPEHRLLAVTSLSFDIAGLELLVPLTLGARIVIADEDTVFDGKAMAALIERREIDAMQATPATWRTLLASGWRPGRDFLALCGGEAMPPAMASALLDAGVDLFNLYGPTETTVWSTAQRVEHVQGGAVPIGEPIANTQLFLLDERMRMVPQGMAGQLYIGGAGLADGYVGRDDLTRERFVANPHLRLCPWSSSRLYATGDQVRIDGEGRLLYLSRIDDQVKVRGYRIELGEIEAALEVHPQVANATAHVAKGGDGEDILVAHVVVRDGDWNPAALTAHLEARLPYYMVPRVLAPIDALPLTPNGKVDRRRLPAIVAPAKASRIAPRTQTEMLVADAFATVLGVTDVGANDDFFALGGHSLQIVALLDRIAEGTGIAMRVRDVFSTSTVESLASTIDGKSAVARLLAVDEVWEENGYEEISI